MATHANSFDWTIAGAKAYDSAELGAGGLEGQGLPVALYITGINGHTLTMGARKRGSSDTFEDMDGMVFTADKVYAVTIPEGLEVDFKETGASPVSTCTAKIIY